MHKHDWRISYPLGWHKSSCDSYPLGWLSSFCSSYPLIARISRPSILGGECPRSNYAVAKDVKSDATQGPCIAQKGMGMTKTTTTTILLSSTTTT